MAQTARENQMHYPLWFMNQIRKDAGEFDHCEDEDDPIEQPNNETHSPFDYQVKPLPVPEDETVYLFDLLNKSTRNSRVRRQTNDIARRRRIGVIG
jgi:hypothetical protein